MYTLVLVDVERLPGPAPLHAGEQHPARSGGPPRGVHVSGRTRAAWKTAGRVAVAVGLGLFLGGIGLVLYGLYDLDGADGVWNVVP